MKYIVMIGDGMADEPCARLEGKTPLAAAQKRVRELEAENRTLRAYINGVERGLRAKQPEIRIERSDGG